LDLKNIRIKDGETLVIGGMIQESEQKTVNKIPFLGDLPLIRPLFRSTSTSKGTTELVIMITPKIINDGENLVSDSL
jgi:type IV pilus assembly protein PilQ